MTSIGDYAFYGCGSLTSITIPDGVTSIGDWAFFYCNSLTSISIPDSVTSIGDNAFWGCVNNNGITLPDNIISVGRSVFSCKAYATVGSKTAKAMGKTENSFYPVGEKYALRYIYNGEELSGLELTRADNDVIAITIPDVVTSIAERAFSDCDQLTALSIPTGVTNIENEAFYDCGSLTNVTIPDSVTSIGASAFDSCIRLSSVNLPERLTTICEQTFSGCFRLKSIAIPDGVTSIEKNAFQHCVEMQKILIPRSVLSFGDEVFGDMYYEGTVYCYRNSKADEWAGSYGYDVVYLDDVTEDDISEVFLPESFKMLIGTERDITAAVFPDAHKTVTWSSSDPQVAEVQDGHIRALSAGTADITAACGTASDTVRVTVFLPAESFELPEEIWIQVGISSFISLGAKNIQPANADVQLTWSCSENLGLDIDYARNCCYVYSNKVGDGTVVGTDISGVSRTVIVHVCPRVKSVIFDPTEYTVHVGEKIQLHAFAKTGNTTYENKLVYFYSQNYSVASVNEETGIVYGNGVGTTQIVADAFNPDNAVRTACTVTVIAADESTYTLPAGLTSIEDEAFMGAGFERVIIPDGCRSIGHLAFANCSRLVYIRIPASVTEIAEDAFDGCGAELVIDRRSN